jgi:hypothetical protein
MKKLYGLIIGVTLFLFSCKSHESVINTKLLKQYKLYDAEWSKTLIEEKDDAKNQWLEFIGHDLNYVKDRFGISISKVDLETLDFVPIESYIIDSTSFANLNKQSSLYNALKLNKKNASYLVFKNGQRVIYMRMVIVNGKFKFDGWTSPAVAVGNKFSQLYKSKKLTFLEVGVDNNPVSKYIRRYNVLIDENGAFMNLSISGDIRPFEAELEDFQKAIASGYIW